MKRQKAWVFTLLLPALSGLAPAHSWGAEDPYFKEELGRVARQIAVVRSEREKDGKTLARLKAEVGKNSPLQECHKACFPKNDNESETLECTTPQYRVVWPTGGMPIRNSLIETLDQLRKDSGKGACEQLAEAVQGDLEKLSAGCRRRVNVCRETGMRQIREFEARIGREDAEIASLEKERTELRRDAARSIPACPTCSEGPSTGQYVVAGLQALTPVILGGLSSYNYAKTLNASASLESQRIDALVKMGVPPTFSGLGAGLGIGGISGFGLGFGGYTSGFGGFPFGGSGFPNFAGGLGGTAGFGGFGGGFAGGFSGGFGVNPVFGGGFNGFSGFNGFGSPFGFSGMSGIGGFPGANLPFGGGSLFYPSNGYFTSGWGQSAFPSTSFGGGSFGGAGFGAGFNAGFGGFGANGFGSSLTSGYNGYYLMLMQQQQAQQNYLIAQQQMQEAQMRLMQSMSAGFGSSGGFGAHPFGF